MLSSLISFLGASLAHFCMTALLSSESHAALTSAQQKLVPAVKVYNGANRNEKTMPLMQ